MARRKIRTLKICRFSLNSVLWTHIATERKRDIGRVRERNIYRQREKETEKARKTPIQTENEERKHGIDFEQQFGFNCIYSTNFIEAE